MCVCVCVCVLEKEKERERLSLSHVHAKLILWRKGELPIDYSACTVYTEDLVEDNQ
jgi:hypothetical protein